MISFRNILMDRRLCYFLKIIVEKNRNFNKSNEIKFVTLQIDF